MSQEEQIKDLQRQIDELKQIINHGKFSNLQVFDTPIQVHGDIRAKAGGLTIGITDNKLGFFGATPVLQQAYVPDPSGGAVIDLQARGAIVSLLTELETLGLLASY